MKALVLTAPETVSYQDAPDPQQQDGDSLVRVDAVGICGSDMHAYLGHDERRPTPIILGHEAAGEVLDGAHAGRMVAVNPLVTCGVCSACRAGRTNICATRQIISMPPRPGAFAEQVAIPARNVHVFPAGWTAEKAALAEPLAVSWHAVCVALQMRDGDGLGESALVIGGGAIGVAAALALNAQFNGAVVLVETNAIRRAYLEEWLSIDVRDPEDVADAQFGLVIDTVGYAPTRALSSRVAEPGSLICHVGLGSSDGGLDIRRMTLQEIGFLGTYAYTADDFADTVAAMIDGRLGKLDWVEVRSLADGGTAFGDIRGGTLGPPKVILRP